MIAFLEGILAEALPTQIVVNVQGVGYQVMIPISSFERLPEPGSKVKILTHLAVREDAHILYGFFSSGERDLFRLLLHHVSGVGPKIARELCHKAGVNPQAHARELGEDEVARICFHLGLGFVGAEDDDADDDVMSDGDEGSPTLTKATTSLRFLFGPPISCRRRRTCCRTTLLAASDFENPARSSHLEP